MQAHTANTLVVLNSGFAYYVVPSLLKEKPDIVNFHISSNNVNYKNSEDPSIDKITR